MKKIILLLTVFFMVCGCVCDTNNQTHDGQKTSTELNRSKERVHVYEKTSPFLIIDYREGGITVLVDRETRVQYIHYGVNLKRRDGPDGNPVLYDGDL